MSSGRQFPKNRFRLDLTSHSLIPLYRSCWLRIELANDGFAICFLSVVANLRDFNCHYRLCCSYNSYWSSRIHWPTSPREFWMSSSRSRKCYTRLLFVNKSFRDAVAPDLKWDGPNHLDSSIPSWLVIKPRAQSKRTMLTMR